MAIDLARLFGQQDIRWFWTLDDRDKNDLLAWYRVHTTPPKAGRTRRTVGRRSAEEIRAEPAEMFASLPELPENVSVDGEESRSFWLDNATHLEGTHG